MRRRREFDTTPMNASLEGLLREKEGIEAFLERLHGMEHVNRKWRDGMIRYYSRKLARIVEELDRLQREAEHEQE